MSSPDVIVVGAGVLGLSCAAELAARGHAVTVIDPGEANASSVAAGMIAPALESLVDDLGPERAALLRRARDLWPAFAARHDLILHREGADWRGPGASGHLGRLRALGFEVEPIDGGLTTPDDWRVNPRSVLDNLARTAGLSLIRARVARASRAGDNWSVQTDGGVTVAAPHLVIATGAASALAGLPDAAVAIIDAVEPIKGQLTHLRLDPPPRVLRGPGAYVAPSRGGILIGATMRSGARDLTPDTVEADRQVSEGLGMLGQTAAEVGETRVGVRGATPDGLPLAGAVSPGLHLALAPRRNGWLLGPLVAAVVADGIEDEAPMADAAALDPLRFVSRAPGSAG